MRMCCGISARVPSPTGPGSRLRVQETARGVQAVEVLRIDPPEVDDDRRCRISSEADLPSMRGRAAEPARVKWFDKAKGFGFANVFGRPEDVFIHVEVLRRSGLADLQPGEAVCLRVVEGSAAAWRSRSRAGTRLARRGAGAGRRLDGACSDAALAGSTLADCAPDRVDLRGDWGQARFRCGSGRRPRRAGAGTDVSRGDAAQCGNALRLRPSRST